MYLYKKKLMVDQLLLSHHLSCMTEIYYIKFLIELRTSPMAMNAERKSNSFKLYLSS